jgi:hypothetical protein
MLTGPDEVRLQGKTASSRPMAKVTRLTLSRHSEAGGFMPLVKTGEIPVQATWPRDLPFVCMINYWYLGSGSSARSWQWSLEVLLWQPVDPVSQSPR